MSGGRTPAVRRARALSGEFAPPGDKSITHRAVLFGLLAEGETRIVGPNPGGDCLGSLAAAEAFGARTARDAQEWRVLGCGGALRESAAEIDCGNSGTTIRLLAGIAAGQPFLSRLTGDASLRRRPMARVIEPLRQMGADIAAAEGDRPPLAVRGGALRPLSYDVPVASAQVATCVLLAGLRAGGRSTVRLPGPARDHTERMLPAFGVPLDVVALPGGGRAVSVVGGAALKACDVSVPGDFSSAAFLLAAAAADPGAEVTVRGVSLNPTRTGLLDVLAAMGAPPSVTNVRNAAGEPVGDVTVRGPAALQAFSVPPEWVPRLVDEVPAWVVLASAARGISRVTGASELRVKESDRIVALVRNLTACGIAARELPDGLEVHGGVADGARVEAHLDHRIVMAFAALGARTAERMTFDDVSSVETSFPGFFATLALLGAGVEEDVA
jgi:3-phosphoshikimate 1-carboxyvinyltransferase